MLIVAGLAAALLVNQREQRSLREQVQRLSRLNAELRYELKQATVAVADARQDATGLDRELGSSKTHATSLVHALSDARDSLSERERQEAGLRREIETLRAKLADPASRAAREELQTRVDALQEQLVALLTRALDDAGQKPAGADPSAIGPPAVVRVGERQAFVVIDFGTERGAMIGRQLAIRRGTTKLAQVLISDARPRFSIAQVLPGPTKGQLQPGDIVVLQP